MPFNGKIGDTLRLRDIGARHRYIILTNPNSNGNVVILNFTTAKYFEWLVTFTPKDDRDLFTRKCTPNYHDACLYPLSALFYVARQNPKDYIYCPENLTRRIVVWALQSKYISLEIIDELKKQYPDEYDKYFST